MASPIWNEKEQRWTLRVTTDGVTRKFTSNKKGVAGKKEVLKRARMHENGSTMPHSTTVAQCWDKFIEMNEHRLGAHSESLKQYKKLGRLYILPAIGKKRMTSVTKNDLQNILNTATPQNGRCEVLSKKYISNIRMTIQVFIRYCYENDFCEMYKGTLYIPQGHPTVGRDILQPDEIKRLFEPSDLHYHRAICFMLCTGMRPSEVLGLQWRDISSDHITINRGVNASGQITSGKNDNAHRIIPLTTFTSEMLQAQKRATESLQSEWVFCSVIGLMGSQSTMGHHYDQLAKERNLSGSLYSMRHTFVSMVKNTMPEQMVKTIVGHSATMDTFGTYGHAVDGELKQAAEIMDLTFTRLAK